MKRSRLPVAGIAVIVIATGIIAGVPGSSAIAQDVGICSAAYARLPRKTQKGAKIFGRQCLAQQGAVPQTLTSAALAAMLSQTVGVDHDLVGLTPDDVADFCPTYPRLEALQRAVFWQVMLARIVVQESARRAAEPYWEFAQNQYSIGLLQLSLADEQNYRCGFTTEVDLTKPALNLQCGVTIMARLIRGAHRIGGDAHHTAIGAAAYWSTLRAKRRRADGSPAENSRTLVINDTRALPFCRRR